MFRYFALSLLLSISVNSYAQVIAENTLVASDSEKYITNSKKEVDASDGTFTEKVTISWKYTPPQSGTFSIYRNTNAEEPGDPIMENPKYHLLSDRTAISGVIYYYTVFFKSPTKRIIEVGKDSGYTKVSEFVIDEQTAVTDVLDSGNGKFRLDSLTINPINPAMGDEISFNYSLSNNNAFSIPQVQVKFWLSQDEGIDSSDKLLLTKRFETFAPNNSIQEILPTNLPSNTEAGNYYLIAEIIVEATSLQTLVENFTIEE